MLNQAAQAATEIAAAHGSEYVLILEDDASLPDSVTPNQFRETVHAALRSMEITEEGWKVIQLGAKPIGQAKSKRRVLHQLGGRRTIVIK